MGMNEETTARPADATPGGWVDSRLPEELRPWARLMRLDRPVGVWLLLWPCWWSVMLAGAASGLDPWYGAVWKPLVMFALGAVVMRAAGCIINDLWDRDIDAKVARTDGRPIASGGITMLAAFILMFVLAMIGLALLLWFNTWTVIVGLASVPFIIFYPLAKRFTDWPQIVLGIVFNWGALLGWCAVMDGTPGIPAVLLYAACFFWTLGYDTIYAHQDKEDDVMAGVKSSALALGDRTKPFLWVTYGLAILLIGVAGLRIGMGPLFYLGLAGAAYHFVWQIQGLNIDDPDNCLRMFKSNVNLGWIVFGAMLLGFLWQG